MDGVKHGFRNEQNADKCQWRAQPQTGHPGPPGKTGRNEQNCPLDMTGLPSSWDSLQKTCKPRPSASLCGGERYIALTGAVASWSLLGETESVFIKGLAPGR